eukprot:TRINITY_DN1868_c1_g2_i1.p1 TRINITY_DN1868_c1_g2~~TRINITY_DN1868_c1_g2_i1.p1  ORF type:complete len:527 (+),score=106.42 TRINITY_DN1868_c1_g2_i1:171-1751(+)
MVNDDGKKRKWGDSVDTPNGSFGFGDTLADLAPYNASPAFVRKLSEFFVDVKQLQDLLAKAAIAHPDVLDSIRAVASTEAGMRKVFVRGLASETTSEGLKKFFSKYGEVQEGCVVLDKVSSRSRGFGFITFKTLESAVESLLEPSKFIDGRMTVSQLACLGATQSTSQPSSAQVAAGASSSSQHTVENMPRKIYVGNVKEDISAERLLEFFLQYGEIEEGPIGFDRTSNKSRGFALFVYRTEEGAKAAVAEATKVLDGHKLFVKYATASAKSQQQQSSQQETSEYGQHPQTEPLIRNQSQPHQLAQQTQPGYTQQHYQQYPPQQYGSAIIQPSPQPQAQIQQVSHYAAPVAMHAGASAAGGQTYTSTATMAPVSGAAPGLYVLSSQQLPYGSQYGPGGGGGVSMVPAQQPGGVGPYPAGAMYSSPQQQQQQRPALMNPPSFSSPPHVVARQVPAQQQQQQQPPYYMPEAHQFFPQSQSSGGMGYGSSPAALPHGYFPGQMVPPQQQPGQAPYPGGYPHSGGYYQPH